MFKISRPETRAAIRETSVKPQELDETVWPPAIAHQVPTGPKKKPIFKEPAAQGIMFLAAMAVPLADYLRVPHQVYILTACFSFFVTGLLLAYIIWKTRREKRLHHKIDG